MESGYSFARIACVLITVAFGLGCAQIPQGEFESYREAFASARSAAEGIAIEHEKTVDARREQSAAIQAPAAPAPPPAPPSDFDVSKAKGAAGATHADDLVVRVQAWEAVSRFNDALIALAEGRSATQMAGSFSALGGSVESLATSMGGSLPGGAGAVLAIGKTIIDVAERARAREDFKRAVEEASPIILKVVDLLQEDASSYFALRVSFTEGERADLGIRAKTILKAAKSVTAEFKAPVPGSPLESSRRGLQTRLDKAVDVLFVKVPAPARGQLKTLGSSSTGGNYSGLVNSQIEQEIARLEELVKEWEALDKDLRIYHSALTSYVKLLEALKGSLNAFERSSQTPGSLQASVAPIVTAAIQVRKDLDSLRK